MCVCTSVCATTRARTHNPCFLPSMYPPPLSSHTRTHTHTHTHNPYFLTLLPLPVYPRLPSPYTHTTPVFCLPFVRLCVTLTTPSFGLCTITLTRTYTTSTFRLLSICLCMNLTIHTHTQALCFATFLHLPCVPPLSPTYTQLLLSVSPPFACV